MIGFGRWKAQLGRRQPPGGRPNDHRIVLRARRLSMLPTKQGLVFAALLLIILVTAINYELQFAYLLAFVLMGAGVVSMLYTQRNLAGLIVSPAEALPVFEGDEARFVIKLENPSREPRLAVRIEYRSQDRDRVELVDVPGHGETCVTLAVRSRHRGRLAMPSFIVKSRYPLGLTRVCSAAARLPMEIIVYPAPERWALDVRSGEQPGDGMHETRGDEDFRGLRDHRPNDGRARVSWRHSARGAGLQTKLLGREAEPAALFDYQSLADFDPERRLRRLAHAVCEYERRGLRYGIALPGGRSAESRGRRHLEHCLTQLALHT